jgi:hypothetical protein
MREFWHDRRFLADADASCSDVDAESDWIIDREEDHEHLPGKRRVGVTETLHRGRRKKGRGQDVVFEGEMVLDQVFLDAYTHVGACDMSEHRSSGGGGYDDMSADEPDSQQRPSQRMASATQQSSSRQRQDLQHSGSGGRDKDSLRADYKVLHARYTKLKTRHSKLKAKYAKLKAAHTQCLVQKLKRATRPDQAPSASTRDEASSTTSTRENHEMQQSLVCTQLQRFDLSS